MESKKGKKGTLSVQDGVPQPPSVNKRAVERMKSLRKKEYSAQEYVEGILSGDRMMLSQAITLVESSLPEHQARARIITEKCLPRAGNSFRIGITGVPGVGKSTFIESFGLCLMKPGGKLAVLAIDPSSERSKGSILGDKTRMENLSAHPSCFIRPSPSAGSLGGVARKTRETIILCEAAGYDHIFIETVGVGQSETAVHSMVDFFLLLMLAGAGDELQGIKRGIMEMADMIAITKADGNNVEKAQRAMVQYKNALHMFPPPLSGWTPRVVTCSAVENTGIEDLWELIREYRQHAAVNGYFEARRQVQARYWMYESIQQSLMDGFYQHPGVRKMLKKSEQDVISRQTSPFHAASKLLEIYLGKPPGDVLP